jgi:dTDP-4-amino-4,6-dideoxygalactose transaminase
MYYLLLNSRREREELIQHLRKAGIGAVFHYIPLHSSPAGERYGRAVGPLPVTDELSGRLVRLPLWPDLGAAEVERVVAAVREFCARPV